MPLQYLLDTNTISEVSKPSPARPVHEKIRQHAAEFAISAPGYQEMVYGVLRAADPIRRQRLVGLLMRITATVPILPYNHDAARWHAGSGRGSSSGLQTATTSGSLRWRRPMGSCS